LSKRHRLPRAVLQTPIAGGSTLYSRHFRSPLN
jgi:hypothetical protein